MGGKEGSPCDGGRGLGELLDGLIESIEAEGGEEGGDGCEVEGDEGGDAVELEVRDIFEVFADISKGERRGTTEAVEGETWGGEVSEGVGSAEETGWSKGFEGLGVFRL
jgi:hypothetical protein